MDWFDRVPKAEIHLHLEGAIPEEALWEVIQKYGGDPEIPDLDSLRERFVFRDFLHFLEVWKWKNTFLRQYEDFSFISEMVARDLLRQNIRYAEVFFSARDFSNHGLKAQYLAAAIRQGLDRVPGIEINLVADLVRSTPEQIAVEYLQELSEVKDLGILGIGIGGDEAGYPPALFTQVYESARRLGFHTSAHAGEGAGPASVWSAIHDLQVERIGHGVRSVEDPRLLAVLAERQIPLEVCPFSNVRTRVVDSLADHPIRQLIEAGIPVTVNSDDPKMFGNSLAEEYRGLHTRLGLSLEEIRGLILRAVEVSWASAASKQRIMQIMMTDPAWAIL